MPAKTQIPKALDQHLLTSSHGKSISIATYVERGSLLITTEAIRALSSMIPELRAKILRIKGSELLKRRTETLLRYFEETVTVRSAPDAPARDIAFALFYFLKGYDRIPDSIPEIGLLDDSIVVNTVLQWHQTALQQHWTRHGRDWPADH